MLTMIAKLTPSSKGAKSTSKTLAASKSTARLQADEKGRGDTKQGASGQRAPALALS